MAEDVCECWEDLEQSEVLDKKLQQLGLRSDQSDGSSAAANDAAVTSRLQDDRSSSSTGSVTVLRRPTPESTTRPKRQEDEFGTRLNADSQPFVPRSQVPAIQMEDTTRTQFQPKLMILKRETRGGKKSDGAGGQRANTGPTNRTFEEREAQYLKARERIMGSATPSPAESSVPTKSPGPSLRSGAVTGQPEVPLVRQPQGPSADGGRGFVRTKR